MMSSQEKKIFFDFMTAITNRLNRALATNYAIQQILIQKGIVSIDQMKETVREAEQLPERKLGSEMLNEMIKDFNQKETES
jgi:hypothetical protein